MFHLMGCTKRVQKGFAIDSVVVEKIEFKENACARTGWILLFTKYVEKHV